MCHLCELACCDLRHRIKELATKCSIELRDSSGQFVLEGAGSEVHRILQDLSKLTQKHDTMESNRRSPVPIPLPLRPRSWDR
jgi:hypothetical protein